MSVTGLATPVSAPAWGTTLWLVWLAWAVWITLGPFSWLVEAFRNPGPEFYRLLVWALPVFTAAMGFYLWIRRAGLWRSEPVIIAGVCAGMLLVYHPFATLLSTGLFLDCYALGAWLLARLALGRPGPPVSEVPVATALGIAMLGPLLFLLGIAHLYYWWISAAVLALPCILLYRYWVGLKDAFAEMWSRWKQSADLRSPLAGIGIIYIAIAALASCIMMLAPSVAFDAIHMHLREAFYYAGQHGLTPLPGLEYSYFPGAYEALISLMAMLGGQAAAQLPSALFFGLTVLLGIRFSREAGSSRGATLTGIAALVTMPVFHWTASVAKNDLMMALFELAALECFLCWRRDGNFRWILAGAFLLASAFDVKHVALFGAIPLGGMFLFAVCRQPGKLPAFAKLVLVLVLAGTYWHARALVLKGNPLYPESISRATSAAIPGGTPSSGWTGPFAGYAQTIWRVHFDARFAFEGPLRTPLGIVLVMFLPAWILFRKKEQNRETPILALFASLYLAYWIHTYPVLRYSLPATIIVFVLTGSRVGEWFEQGGVVLRASLLAAIAYSLTFAMLASAIIGLNGPQLLWLARRVDDRDYLHAASATYRASEFLSKVAMPEERVLGVEFFKSVYSPAWMHIDGYLVTPDQTLTAECLAELRDARYRWIVALRTVTNDVQSAAGANLRSPTNLTPVQLVKSYEDNYYVIFRADR